MFGGGAKTPAPPPPPPPPPNPPTYASAYSAAPSTASTAGQSMGLFSGAALSSNPLGPADQRAVQRKQLFGA